MSTDMFKMSPNIVDLAKKLILVQQKQAPLNKSATNPFHKNKYTPLNEYLEGLKPIWNEVGLVVNQFMSGNFLITSLIDPDTGQYIQSGYELNFKDEKNEKFKTAQEMGSQITYARRYSLASIFMTTSDEDDDGNAASLGKKVILNYPPKNDGDKNNVEVIKENILSRKIKSVEDLSKEYMMNSDTKKNILILFK